MSGTNRRRAPRYPLDIPVRAGEWQGHTRDVSSRGLYFVMPPDMAVGSTLEMEMDLPKAGGDGPVRIRLRARIIRVENLEGQRGVAAEIETWEVPDDHLEPFLAAAAPPLWVAKTCG